jgi:hypothetical protein
VIAHPTAGHAYAVCQLLPHRVAGLAAVRRVRSLTKWTRGIWIERRRRTCDVLREGGIRDCPYCREEKTHDDESARIRSDL